MMENPNMRALIIGSVLGDGHIQKTQSKTQKCRLRMAQSPNQKSYLEAKYSLLSSICPCPSAPKYDQRNNTYHFYTHYSLEIKHYHDLLYHDHIVPLLQHKKESKRKDSWVTGKKRQ